MTRGADRNRALDGLRQAVGGLNALEAAMADCPDPQLRALLKVITRGRRHQSERLQNWLRKHDRIPGGQELFSQEQVPGQTPPSAQALPSGQTQADNPNQHASNGAHVLQRKVVSPDLLIFKTTRPDGLSFTPGQSVKIGLQGVNRPFSIASAPHEPFLEFFAELAPGGAMSGRLRELQPGDLLTLDQPRGGFVLDQRYARHLMIATVTGISPFVSMVRGALHHGRREHVFHLLHGASYHTEFGYRDELERLAARHPQQLHYTPTVSRPEDPANAGWRGARGRVGEIVEDVISHYSLTPDSTRLYACGQPAMVDAVAQTYTSRGFVVSTERYG